MVLGDLLTQLLLAIYGLDIRFVKHAPGRAVVWKVKKSYFPKLIVLGHNIFINEEYIDNQILIANGLIHVHYQRKFPYSFFLLYGLSSFWGLIRYAKPMKMNWFNRQANGEFERN